MHNYSATESLCNNTKFASFPREYHTYFNSCNGLKDMMRERQPMHSVLDHSPSLKFHFEILTVEKPTISPMKLKATRFISYSAHRLASSFYHLNFVHFSLSTAFPSSSTLFAMTNPPFCAWTAPPQTTHPPRLCFALDYPYPLLNL